MRSRFHRSLMLSVLLLAVLCGSSGCALLELGAAEGAMLGAEGAALAGAEVAAGIGAAGAEMALADAVLGADALSLRLAAASIGEAELATIAGRVGMPGVLDAMSMASDVMLDGTAGRVMLNGRAVLMTEDLQLLRTELGQPVARLQQGRIFATDSTGRITGSIGEYHMSRGATRGMTPIEVTRPRQGWYRVVVGRQPVAAALGPGALAMVLAADRDRKKKELSSAVASALSATNAALQTLQRRSR